MKIETNELCSYGCGNKAEYINNSKRLMCQETSSKCPEIRRKNREGLKRAYKNGKRKINGKDLYVSLSQETKDRMAWNRGDRNADFKYDGKGSHKEVLIRERGHKCEECQNTTWLVYPIPLELEHSNGDRRDNTRENLKLLCPNCHALTKFYRGRNINKGNIKVTDDQIKEALLKESNVRQVLLSLGLTPKGGNYARVYKLKHAA